MSEDTFDTKSVKCHVQLALQLQNGCSNRVELH